MIQTPTHYVQMTPQGGWRICDSRVSLDSIVHAYWQGEAPEAIAADFPSLSLEQVHGAIAFYLRNRDEIDRYLIAQDARWEELRKSSEAACGPLLQRIRGARRANKQGFDS
ncbi:MAG TPA: DUF433 domain-containing protein [Pirellulales bacterium]|nr:DUF433 domain-containing protein [Pirellulales bacterium]